MQAAQPAALATATARRSCQAERDPDRAEHRSGQGRDEQPSALPHHERHRDRRRDHAAEDRHRRGARRVDDGRRAERHDGGDRAGDHPERGQEGAAGGVHPDERADEQGEHAAHGELDGRDRSGDQQADEGARGADDAGDACEASQEPVAFLVDALHATPCRVRHPEERVPSLEL